MMRRFARAENDPWDSGASGPPMFVVSTPTETIITSDEPKAVDLTNEVGPQIPTTVEMIDPTATSAKWVVPPDPVQAEILFRAWIDVVVMYAQNREELVRRRPTNELRAVWSQGVAPQEYASFLLGLNAPVPPRPKVSPPWQPPVHAPPFRRPEPPPTRRDDFRSYIGHGPDAAPWQPRGRARIPGRGYGHPSVPTVAGVNVIHEVERLIKTAPILRGMRMPDISIRRAQRPATLGLAIYRNPELHNYMIRFTDYPTADKFDVLETTAHELAHLRTGPRAAHNKVWAKNFEIVGNQGYGVSFVPYGKHTNKPDSLGAVLRGGPKPREAHESACEYCSE